ncbi:MAG: hypothetical protein ACR2G6_15770 [Gemmatimonadaceae bacterium]
MDREKDLELNDSAHTANRDADQLRALLGSNSVPEASRMAGDANREHADSGDKAVGGTVGGVGGAAVGAGIGTLVAGPIGTAIGALAGALGGWWAGRATAAAADYQEADDLAYRSDYETAGTRPADRVYDDVRPAYQLGHIARRNPDYEGKAFEEVERDLEKGWTTDLRTKHGDWSGVREHARSAYSRTTDKSRETTPRSGDRVENAQDERAGNADLRF